jgi:hypothetical protein
MHLHGKITSAIYDWSATKCAEGKWNFNLDHYLSYQWHRQTLERLAHDMQMVRMCHW